jgi:hypothetical protein
MTVLNSGSWSCFKKCWQNGRTLLLYRCYVTVSPRFIHWFCCVCEVGKINVQRGVFGV